RVGLFDKPDDLLGAESALLHVRPLGFTDFIASAGTAQWGQVKIDLFWRWRPPSQAGMDAHPTWTNPDFRYHGWQNRYCQKGYEQLL
ncbi:hypothetical protein WGE90_22985, partial [Xanthomonas euvesicatoria pv. euvesicatoria]